MKAKRFLFLVMAICLVSGVKAQFYDSADDIYFYLLESDGGKKNIYISNVLVFNFDGRKACELGGGDEESVKKHLKDNPDYYGEKVETSEYDMKYEYSSYGTCYKSEHTDRDFNSFSGITFTRRVKSTYIFSSDRKSLSLDITINGSGGGQSHTTTLNLKYKKVDKSYFRIGRSRTPSGTMYE